MTKYLLGIGLLIWSVINGFGQQTPATIADTQADATLADTSVIEPSPDFEPSFMGGSSRLYSFINSRIQYPTEAVRNGVSGKVVVQFSVCADGQLCDYKVVESPHESLSKESLRIIKAMPRWEPATKNGQPVKVIYSLPIVYNLQ